MSSTLPTAHVHGFALAVETVAEAPADGIAPSIGGASAPCGGAVVAAIAGAPSAPGDAAAQTTYILDKIAASFSAAGGKIEDVVRTRVYLRHESDCEAVSRAHGRVFSNIMPANTLIVAGGLIGDHEVEIEAEAIVS